MQKSDFVTHTFKNTVMVADGGLDNRVSEAVGGTYVWQSVYIADTLQGRIWC